MKTTMKTSQKSASKADSKTSILWFRRDLRLHDNAALNRALQDSDTVLPVYIHSPDEEQPWSAGGASRWWLHHSLAQLDNKLRQQGLRLFFFSGDSEQILTEIITATGADRLLFNKLYEPHLHSRDAGLSARLAAKVEVTVFDSGLFFSPGTVLNNQQLPYRVFTPFYRKLRPLLDYTQAYSADDEVTGRLNQRQAVAIDSMPSLNDLPLNDLGLLDTHRWHQKLHQYWQPGEANAFELIDDFMDGPLQHYQTARDLPSQAGTSGLSAYLHFGEITPQQIYLALQPYLDGAAGGAAVACAEVFLRQLVWREFAHNVLWHFPFTDSRPMDARYKDSFWQFDQAAFDAWCHGQTGVAIVDAGMQQLWQSGWMHNRVRMIVSSFLTKNLGIHWLHGAKWFWQTLVDADLANNSMGWQWVAGCGVDAAPYYRIFNPQTQTKRFDANFRYINTWLPEHIELDYPAAIVDLADSRQQALQRYKQNISQQ